MRKRGIIPHWGCFLTVVMKCIINRAVNILFSQPWGSHSAVPRPSLLPRVPSGAHALYPSAQVPLRGPTAARIDLALARAECACSCSPGGQSVHSVDRRGAYFPATQPVQRLEPRLRENEPAAHGVHAVAPLPLVVPRAQA